MLMIVGGFALAVLVRVAGFAANKAIRATALERDMPGASASAQHVMKTYLDAATEQDCDLTSALTAASGEPAWCGSRGPIVALFGTDPQLRSYSKLSEPQPYVSGQECFTADIDQAGLSGAEPGQLPFEFCLVRMQSGWRILSQDVSAP